MDGSFEKSPENHEIPPNEPEWQSNDRQSENPVSDGSDVVERQQSAMREKENDHQEIGDVITPQSADVYKSEDKPSDEPQDASAETSDEPTAPDDAGDNAAWWVTDSPGHEPEAPEKFEQNQAESIEEPDQNLPTDTDNQVEQAETAEPEQAAADQGEQTDAASPKPEDSAEDYEGRHTSPEQNAVEQPDEFKVITDDSLKVNERTLEDTMRIISQDQQSLYHDKFSEAGFKEIEKPEFGKENGPPASTERLAETIRGLGRNQLLLCDEKFSFMSDSSDSPLPASASFTEIPLFSEGRERSRQGETFGQLLIETHQDPPVSAIVSKKPYDGRLWYSKFNTSPERAVAHDWAANVFLREHSTSGAYRPIGVYRTDEDFSVPGLVTLFNEHTISLDKLFDDVRLNEHGEPDLDASQVRARQALFLGHFGVGVAHGLRIIHGDAAPQNFDTDGSHIIFNVTTTLSPFSSVDTNNHAPAVEDLDDFVRGAVHPAATNEQMRVLTGRSLKDYDIRSGLYQTYLKGAALGARRAGYIALDVLVKEHEHNWILDEYIERYVPLG